MQRGEVNVLKIARIRLQKMNVAMTSFIVWLVRF